MPDRSDVEQALASLIAGVVYPSGIDGGSAVGAQCRVYRGWPTPRVIEEEVGSGIVHITIRSEQNGIRNRTRYPEIWQGVSPTPTLFSQVSGDQIIFSGQGGTGYVVGVRVDGRAYVFRMRDGDTSSLVAAALADQIRSDRPALASGSILQIPSGNGILARIVTDGVGGTEIRRQEAPFRVCLWCPDPGTRDSVASTIDVTISAWAFIDVNDWACRLRFSGDLSSDDQALSGIWRRDLIYMIEYPTVAQEVLPSMLFGIADVNSVPLIG